MALPAIFCPQCDTLVLDADHCSACSWRRPVAAGEVGRPEWAVALESRLPREGVRPVAANGSLYIPTSGSEVVAVDSTPAEIENRIKWRYPLEPDTYCHGAAVWGEHLMLGMEYSCGFPAPRGNLLLLSGESSEEVWRFSLNGASLSVPVVDQDTAFFTVNSGWLYALDLANRKELWRRELSKPWSWAPTAPLLTPAGLFLPPSRSEQLTAFDLEKGTIVWTFAAEGWFPYPPVLREGIVYIRCWDRRLYALDQETGREIWRYQAPRDFSSDIWVGQDYLYVGVKDYQGGAESGPPAYALYTLDRRTGERVGRYEVHGHVRARPVATTEAVFVATDDRSPEIKSQGTLYALDASGQNLLWEPWVVEQRFQSDLLLVDSWIIAGTRQGAVYAIRWRAEEETVESPEYYLARDQLEKAAIAYAWQGAYIQAAEIYAHQLDRPDRAGQLYLQAEAYTQVVKLLGRSSREKERAMALSAARAISDPGDRAEALASLGEYLAAAQAYEEAGEWSQAGDCYRQAQAWEQALTAYQQGQALDKWLVLVNDLNRWRDLVDHFLTAGEYSRAAEIYEQNGLFLEAANCYERAGQEAEAFSAYRRVEPEKMTTQARQRLAELAEKMGEVDAAIEAYQALGELTKAANLAEAAGRYQQALALHQDTDNQLKAAEMLQELARHTEAAEIYEQASRWGQAAENWEQQVEQMIKRAGGVRYVRRNQQAETWLQRAIELFEEEANLAEEDARIDYYHECADRCRVKLMQVRGEPLLRLSLQAEQLVANQGNVIHYKVENVGWGAAEELMLSIGGSLLRQMEPLRLGSLGRRRKVEGRLTVVPEIAGEVTLRVKLQGRSHSGELQESLIQVMPVARSDDWLESLTAEGRPAALTLNIQNYVGHGVDALHAKEAPVVDRGRLWEEGSSPSSEEADSEVVSPDELKQQVADEVGSLRRRLVQHYSNLNKLKEQKALYGETEVPLSLQNNIEAEEKNIVEIEDRLAELEP